MVSGLNRHPLMRKQHRTYRSDANDPMFLRHNCWGHLYRQFCARAGRVTHRLKCDRGPAQKNQCHARPEENQQGQRHDDALTLSVMHHICSNTFDAIDPPEVFANQ